eukprot:CAMPEP_0181208896 /NCGR_PEP_ID=MMETSP1096-20121128/22368_1 /TAXON_ID=156174 ORGANISM="Chrysochromulina ericina, Strain CCMP281" /NCGR_SAMPLE_ID=MMETSP1096 /ASSEMBLY_ACC=CAM_ASM_000453 /LENGTH=245 /DNA_ID=CAMNT_0023300003 /DNA_START=258 /DNA_END=994 /DNA_ORIENTATION=-
MGASCRVESNAVVMARGINMAPYARTLWVHETQMRLSIEDLLGVSHSTAAARQDLQAGPRPKSPTPSSNETMKSSLTDDFDQHLFLCRAAQLARATRSRGGSSCSVALVWQDQWHDDLAAHDFLACAHPPLLHQRHRPAGEVQLHAEVDVAGGRKRPAHRGATLHHQRARVRPAAAHRESGGIFLVGTCALLLEPRPARGTDHGPHLLGLIATAHHVELGAAVLCGMRRLTSRQKASTYAGALMM